MGRDLHPLPVGVEGELCIGGVGLARGYLNNPFTTACSFLPSPFSFTGERLYKTGDICRFQESGKIVISGRKVGSRGEMEEGKRRGRGGREGAEEGQRRDRRERRGRGGRGGAEEGQRRGRGGEEEGRGGERGVLKGQRR
jgi:hypothetical protein